MSTNVAQKRRFRAMDHWEVVVVMMDKHVSGQIWDRLRDVHVRTKKNMTTLSLRGLKNMDVMMISSNAKEDSVIVLV